MQQHSAGGESRETELGWVRDDTYYLSDGSCVLLVDRTLFNVRSVVHLCGGGLRRLTTGAAGPPNGPIQRPFLVQCHVSFSSGRAGSGGCLR